jgi:hypothetical protein
MKSHTQAILQSARIAELKMAVALVKPRPHPNRGNRRRSNGGFGYC